MKNLIFIPLFLISFSIGATDYYVKNGGNNSAAGTSDGTAWETISKVNSVSFSAGDNVYFKKGDTFTGTLTPASSGTSGNRITFGAYGSGDDPIITPNVLISPTWTPYGSAGIYQANLGLNPGNLLINLTTKIMKINDTYFSSSVPSPYSGGYDARELMALPESKTFSINSVNVYFWDGLDALYCYGSSITYIRFRGGEDPNDSTFYIAAEESECVYMNAKRYITFQNLQFIGGEYGVNLSSINYTGTDNVIIEDCNIESSNKKVYLHDNTHGVIVRNNTITNHYLSPYKPGSWEYSTSYLYGVRRHYYEFGKYVVATSSSDEIDIGVYMAVSQQNNNTISDNTITECINGIGVRGNNDIVSGNYIEGTSSIGILLYQYARNTHVYDNYLYNCNLPFRFQYVNDNTYPGRIIYAYRNRVYIPDAGSVMYIHYGTVSQGASKVLVYFYNNSFICKTGVYCSWTEGEIEGGTGFTFINNIISASSYNSAGWSAMATQSNLWVWNHNWVSGSYTGAGSGVSVWATDPSNYFHRTTTFWDHGDDPPDFTDILGTEAIGSGDYLGDTFTPLVYDAAGNVFLDPPAMGAYEIPPVGATLVTSIDVWGTGDATTITIEGGTLQMLKKTLPVDATDTTCIWSVADGTGHGSIDQNGLLTAATDGTVTVRATAHDGSGIYGEEIITLSNQTPEPGVGLPTVVTSTIIIPGTTTAQVNDNQITDDGGGTITEKGICWSTSANPTTAGDHENCGTGTAEFDCLITGLIANTTYHIRAYAINSEGTGYGDDVSFVTADEALIIQGGDIIITQGGILIKIE